MSLLMEQDAGVRLGQIEEEILRVKALQVRFRAMREHRRQSRPASGLGFTKTTHPWDHHRALGIVLL